MTDDYYPPLSPTQTGLAGKCPRCGRGDLFDGFLGLKDHCSSCGLDYSVADSGDGPAVFVIFITGFVGVLVAFVVRFAFDASIAVTLGISFAVLVLLTLALLRPMKATLFALQFRNKAEEGRLE